MDVDVTTAATIHLALIEEVLGKRTVHLQDNNTTGNWRGGSRKRNGVVVGRIRTLTFGTTLNIMSEIEILIRQETVRVDNEAVGVTTCQMDISTLALAAATLLDLL